MIIQLKSIASAIDSDTGMVYATYMNGGIDYDSGIHVADLPDELLLSANELDKTLLTYYYKIKKHG